MNKIDNYNRNLAIKRYVEDIVAPLHYLEAKEMLLGLLTTQKNELSNEELEQEIMRHDSGLFTDIYTHELYSAQLTKEEEQHV